MRRVRKPPRPTRVPGSVSTEPDSLKHKIVDHARPADHWSRPRPFTVLHVATNVPVTPYDMQMMAVSESWAKGLVYTDIEGFAIGDMGDLYLLDECGNYAVAPEGRFRIRWRS